MKNMVFFDAIYQAYELEYQQHVRIKHTPRITGKLPGHVFYLKKNCSNICLLSTWSPQKKNERCKGKYISLDLGILYPAPEISNSNLNFKLCWREMLPLVSWNYFLLVPTRILLGIVYFQRFFWRIPLWFSLLGFNMLLIYWGTTWMVKCWNGETNILLLGF